MLKKWTTLAALVLATALILTGCVQGGDVAEILAKWQTQIQNEYNK